MMTMTTYPSTPERPVTRDEIDRLRKLEAEANAALLMLNRAGYAGSEYTLPGGLLLAVMAALASAETARRIRDKIVAQNNDLLDASADTIHDLVHDVDLQRARAEVAEACLTNIPKNE